MRRGACELPRNVPRPTVLACHKTRHDGPPVMTEPPLMHIADILGASALCQHVAEASNCPTWPFFLS